VQIRFDHGPDGGACAFTGPQALIEAHVPGDVPGALAALDAARAEGCWLAGYASYELGYTLEPRLLPLLPEKRRLPLMRFGVYARPDTVPLLRPQNVAFSDMQPLWDSPRYAKDVSNGA